MSLETARQSLVTAIEAVRGAAPGAPIVIEYDNRIVVDTQTQTAPFVCVQIMFMDSYQADISSNPIQRVIGQIHLSAVVKEGKGSAQALALLDYFAPLLQRKQFGTVRTLMSDMAPSKPHLGWRYYPILIPFWYDKFT